MKKCSKKLALQKETLTNLGSVKGGSEVIYTVIIIWDPAPEPMPPVIIA